MKNEFDKFRKEVVADQFLMHSLYVDLERRVGGVEGTTGSLAGTVSSLTSTVEGLHTTIGQMHTTVGQMHTTVGQMHTTVGQVHTTVGRLQTAVGQMQTTVVELHSQVGGMRETMRQVVGHSRLASERMEKMLGAVDKEKVSQTDFQELAQRVADLERRLAG